MHQPRGHWASRTGFVLAAAGSAVGLGNLWKFPYITYENGGGGFVLVYLLAIAAVGLPIMISEILIGRKTQLNAVGAMRTAVGPVWANVGRLGVLTGFVILGYYNVVAGWSLYYVAECADWSVSGYAPGASSPEAFEAFAANGGLQIALSAAFMLATLLVVLKGVGKGIEAVARVLLPALFLIMLLLLGSALTMPGAGEALRFVFVPDFSGFSPNGVLMALGQAFFTLSLGMGAMITYGSYMSRDDSVPSAALQVVVLDTLIAIVATIIMFSVVFTVPGLRDAIGGSTVGMLFITLPEQFYSVVPAGKLLAPLFYVLVAFAALTSTISLLEVIVSYFIDEHGWTRARAAWTVAMACFGLSILCGLSLGANDWLSTVTVFSGKAGLFATLDHLAANWFLPVGGFFITLGAGWFMSRETTYQELVDAHTPAWFNYPAWRLFTRFVAPVAVGIVIGFVIAGRDFS